MPSYRNMMEGYPSMLGAVLQHGIPFKPRDFICREIRPFTFNLTNPSASLYPGFDRRLNYRFFAIETLGYIAGARESWYMELLTKVNSQFSAFAAEDGSLLGAYGPAIRRGFLDAYDLISKDAFTRQAVISIWSPGIFDKIHANTPCTCLLQLYMDDQPRHGSVPSLGLSVYMRSNDLNWGTAYDVPAFCTIQLAMAGCLGWHPGRYTHTAGSFHIYEGNHPAADLAKKISRGVTRQHLLETHPLWHIPQPSFAYLTKVDKPSRAAYFCTQCDRFLRELYHHVITLDKPFKDFVSTHEQDRDTGMREYWLWWSTCIRFSWTKQIRLTADGGQHTFDDFLPDVKESV